MGDTVTIETDTCILRDVRLGENVSYFNFVNLYGCTIGNETKIGAFMEIHKSATVDDGGRYCPTPSSARACISGTCLHRAHPRPA
jgi:UDP-3-O-[3-hydroxymyristoyl] glucosamine N-acyltransferase